MDHRIIFNPNKFKFCSVSSLSHAAGASSIELTGCGTYLCASVHSVLVGRGRDGGMTHSGEPPRHRPCAEGRKEGDKVMKRFSYNCVHTQTHLPEVQSQDCRKYHFPCNSLQQITVLFTAGKGGGPCSLKFSQLWL